MSVIDFLQQLLDAGLPLEQAMIAARAHEAALATREPPVSKGAQRTRRWRERHEASQSVTGDVCDNGDGGDVPPSPSPSPQTPQPRPHPRGESSIAHTRGATRADGAKGFLAFWAEYPRKVGKDAAAKAYTKAFARAEGPEPAETILAGLRRAVPGWDDPEFIPHPSTWLNAGRWQDDAPPPRSEKPHVRPANDHNPLSRQQLARSERDANLARAFRASEAVAARRAQH